MKYIRKQFRLTNSYIKENMLKTFAVLMIVFVALGVVCCGIAQRMPQEDQVELLKQIYQMLPMDRLVDEGDISFGMLLLNNVRATALSYFYGLLPMLFLPLISVLINSALVGFVVGIGAAVSGENVFMMALMYILPHGIFEIPALMLACSAGLRLCMVLTKKIFVWKEPANFGYHFKGALRLFLFYIIPFLLIAAFIEAIVLPAVLM